jgi:hypothetical protein
MVELFLLLPFTLMSLSAGKIAIEHRRALRGGIEIPRTGRLRAVASLDRERQKAIEIGKRELAVRDAEVWDWAFERAIEDADPQRAIAESRTDDRACYCPECVGSNGEPYIGLPWIAVDRPYRIG